MGLLTATMTGLWLGILTSISPCPLATNIAAVSFIGRHVGAPRRVLASGLAYTLGRALAYLLIALILVSSLLSMPEVSHFLQKYMSKLIGPLLIVVGMVLLEMIPLPSFGLKTDERWQKLATTGGAAGAGVLGFIFALSFCPISAALYFGSLVPLAVEQESRMLLPLVYGVGTALPVLLFGLLIAFGVSTVGLWFKRLSSFERWARPATGVVFVLVGVYLAAVNVFGLGG
jgi:cytochrome c biogenesis protein CcdA